MPTHLQLETTTNEPDKHFEQCSSLRSLLGYSIFQTTTRMTAAHNEPDTAGGTELHWPDSEAYEMPLSAGASLLDEFGLASALNSAANMRHKKSLPPSPNKSLRFSPNNELRPILETGKSPKKHRQLKRRVTISGDPSTTLQAQDQTTRIISLPWRVNDGSRDIDGRYTGDINLSFQPHGRGILRFDDGMSNITGQWINGEIAKPTHNSDEQRMTYRRSKTVPESLDQDTRCEHVKISPGQEIDTAQCASSAAPSTTSLAHLNYVLGDVVKSDHHMIVPASETEALSHGSSLNALDFAFVLRSNGSWTYAIVAERLFHEDLGLVLRFVLEKKGTTKTIRRKYWQKGVRPVNPAIEATDDTQA